MNALLQATQAAVISLNLLNGTVLVGSDCHYRPDAPSSTAHRALCQLARRFSAEGALQAAILNSDVTDLPRISKHPRIGWEPQPTVAAELAEVRRRWARVLKLPGLRAAADDDRRPPSVRRPGFGVLALDLLIA
jgi:hypothetical protein